MNETRYTGSAPRTRAGSWWRYAAIGILTIGILGFASALDAKKPIKPPPDPDPSAEVEGGLVYFEDGAETIYELDMETRFLRTLFTRDRAYGTWYNVSDETHPMESIDEDDSVTIGRWFVIEDSVPEDGEYPITDVRTSAIWRRSIFAVNEKGTAYKLTDDPNFEPCCVLGWTAPRWVKGDSEIWFVARKLVAEGEEFGNVIPNSYGYYRITIDIADDGVVSVTDPELIPFSPIFTEMTDGDSSDDYVAWAQFDVTSDGSEFYFNKGSLLTDPESLTLYKLDIENGGVVTGISGDVWFDVEYHAGKDSVLGGNGSLGLDHAGLAQVLADETAEPTVLATSDRKIWVNTHAAWSPSGDQVIYEEGKRSGDTLKVINSSDGSPVSDLLEMPRISIIGWLPKVDCVDFHDPYTLPE